MRAGSLNAAAFSPSGQPMLAAGCGRPGTAGIFTRTGRTWQLTGPALPAAYAHQAITVLRLTTTGKTTTALLAAGTGSAARLLAGWSADGGAHWTLSHAAAAERRHADIGIVRAWQQPGDHPEPPSRERPSPAPQAPGGSCRYCPQAPRPSHRAHQADGTPWPSTAPSSPSGRPHPAPKPGTGNRSSRFPSNSDHQADATSVRHLVRRLFQLATPADDPAPPSCLRARPVPDVPRSRRRGHRPEPHRRSGDRAAVVRTRGRRPVRRGVPHPGSCLRFPGPSRRCGAGYPDGSWLASGQSLACNALIAGAAQALAGWLPVIVQMAAVM